MSDLVNADSFIIKSKAERSKEFNFSVPNQATKCFELERLNKIEICIHSIHFMKLKNSLMLSDEKSTLAHIRRDYAEWQIKKNMQEDFLLI